MSILNVGLRKGRILTTVDLRGHDRLTVGRSPRCDLRLPAANVSRRHALLFRHADGWHITDTASRRGLRSDWRWTRHVCLSPGRIVAIGPVELWIEPTVADEPAAVAHRALAQVDSREPDPTIEGPILHVVDGGTGKLRQFPLAWIDMVTVGRGAECDVSLRDQRVSRLHSVLYTEHRGWYVADAGSASGTMVAAHRTLRRRLGDDLRVHIGGSRLWVEGNEPAVDHAADTIAAAETPAVITARHDPAESPATRK